MTCPKCGDVFLVASTDNWVCTKCYAKSTKDFEIHKVKRPKEEKKEDVKKPVEPQEPKETQEPEEPQEPQEPQTESQTEPGKFKFEF